MLKTPNPKYTVKTATKKFTCDNYYEFLSNHVQDLIDEYNERYKDRTIRIIEEKSSFGRHGDITYENRRLITLTYTEKSGPYIHEMDVYQQIGKCLSFDHLLSKQARPVTYKLCTGGLIEEITVLKNSTYPHETYQYYLIVMENYGENLAEMYDVGPQNGTFITDQFDGKSFPEFEKLFKNIPYRFKIQVLQTIYHLSEQGVYLENIKPENFAIVVNNGRYHAIVLDLSLCKYDNKLDIN
jgi:hypothetical protein